MATGIADEQQGVEDVPAIEAPVDAWAGGSDEHPDESLVAERQSAPEDLPSTAETVAAFESSLSSELDKLREAIAALDKAFSRQASEPPAHAEPSFADLVSDTVLSKTG